LMQVFRDCHKWKDSINFCNNILSLVPNTSDLSLCCCLLLEFPDSIRDQVAHMANAKTHQECYSKDLGNLLTDTYKRGPKKDDSEKPSMDQTLIMLWCHVHDQTFAYLDDEEKKTFQSLMWKRGKGKAGSNKRKIVVGKWRVSLFHSHHLIADIVYLLHPILAIPNRVFEYSTCQEALTATVLGCW
jgi:hypothetical protein